MESLTEDPRMDLEPCKLRQEAHFAFSSSNWPHGNSNTSETMVLRYLDYSIRRKKYGLLSHVRKILFCQQNNRSDIIGKSIDELFSALGDQGKQLKTSLLISSKHLISKEEYLLLSASINSDNTYPIKNSPSTKIEEDTNNIDSIKSTESAIAIPLLKMTD